MKLNISKPVKHNFYFFLLLFFISHIYFANYNICDEYWKEREMWIGDIPPISERDRLSLSEYFELVNFSDVVYTSDWLGIFIFICLDIILLILYCVVPFLRYLVKNHISCIYCRFIDILFFCLFVLFFGPTKYPMYGVIPGGLLGPILLAILIIFRIYQYRKKLIFDSNK